MYSVNLAKVVYYSSISCCTNPKLRALSIRSHIISMNRQAGVWKSPMLRSNSKMLGQKASMLGLWWLSIQEIPLDRFVLIVSFFRF
jgi:hypothetical protein